MPYQKHPKCRIHEGSPENLNHPMTAKKAILQWKGVSLESLRLEGKDSITNILFLKSSFRKCSRKGPSTKAWEQWLDVNSLYTLNKMYGGNPQIPNGLHFIAFQNPVFQSCVCSNAATVKLLPSYDGITSKVHLIKVLLLCCFSLLYGLYQMATTKEDWKQILSVEYFYDAVALSRYSICTIWGWCKL